jgi:hypothetical protein
MLLPRRGRVARLGLGVSRRVPDRQAQGMGMLRLVNLSKRTECRTILGSSRLGDAGPGSSLVILQES